jgi:hypothetical protein
MSNPNNIQVTPWPKAEEHPDGLPVGGDFICAYENHLGVDSIDEAAVLNRGPDRDELWVVSGLSSSLIDDLSNGLYPSHIAQEEVLTWGLAVTRDRKDQKSPAVLEMLEALTRCRVGYGWPTKFVRSGLIGRREFNKLVSGLEAELEANAIAARELTSEIVEAARELGLNPTPTGTDPRFWSARCPQVSHSLFINAEVDEFGCGWCRKRGGPDELAQFVAERRERARKRGEPV